MRKRKQIKKEKGGRGDSLRRKGSKIRESKNVKA